MDKAIRRRNKANIFREMWKHKWLMGMMLVGLVYYAIFDYGPMYGAQIAFREFMIKRGIWGSEWVGLANFRKLFANRDFPVVFRNTITISALKLAFGFPAPILLALLLNELRGKYFKKTIQTISYLPYFLSWVLLGGIFKQILSPTNGTINHIIKSLGHSPIFFLGDTGWFRSTLVFTSIWKGIGWGSVIYLATLSSINPELYEAAVIDGANRLQQVLRITIPCLLPVICIQLILQSGSIINDDFDQIFNLYNPSVYKVGDVISTYTYRQAFEGTRFSYTAAVGLFRNMISFGMVIIVNFVTSRFSEYGIW